MDFRILGSLEVYDNERPLSLGGHQQRALLALLLLRANQVVPVDEIVEDLWGARPPPSATKSVQALISKLRKLLAEPGAVAEDASEDGILLTRSHGYVLTVVPGELDLHRFQSLTEEGRRALAAGRPDEAEERLREALALWRGPPLAEFAYESFAQVEIARLEELRLSALEERIEADLALGRHHDLIPEVEALVAANPLRERLRGQLMIALYRSGRQAEALQVYQQARHTLVDELGIEPGQALQRLEQAILQQDESLDLSREPVQTLPAPERLSGAVTFLFTDIEGSTRLVKQLRERWGSVVADHQRILREAFAAHRGQEIDTHGDAFFVAFGRARDAVLAAAEGQRGLVEHFWPEGAELRVRMGIHSGQAALSEDRYLGLAVHRAARICAVAHGGQILLSQTTVNLLEDEEEELPGIELRDLGERRLKDLDRPVRLCQLVVEGLTSEFQPPKRTGDGGPYNGREDERRRRRLSFGEAQILRQESGLLPGVAPRAEDDFEPVASLNRTNLPIPSTPLVGREQELEEIVALLRRDGVRLLTVTGPGGIGKTRLAIHACGQLIEEHPDGVWFVDLSPLRDPSLVRASIARTFGVRNELERALGARKLLLLLDNFEHVIESGAEIARLLAVCPALNVVLTSRERLNISLEHEYSLNGLTEAEALELFTQRARVARRNFQADEAAQEVCLRLEGLPLAIELAAARSKILTPRALLARLENRLPLLISGPRDMPERQQTLRATIDWSYDLLESEEQLVFARLAVFVGGCALEAAEEVCDTGLDVLAALADKSLLRHDEGRFSMLETIREYALERLEGGGEAEALRRRHAEYFLRFAEQIAAGRRGPQERTWLGRLDAEHENLRGALDWSLETDPELALRLAGVVASFWLNHCLLTDARRWLLEAVERGKGAPAAARARVLRVAGQVCLFLGEFDQGRALCEESLVLARESGDRAEIATSLALVGHAALNDARHEESVALWREIGDNRGLADALHRLGEVKRDRGDLGEARALLEESEALLRKGGSVTWLAQCLSGLADVDLDEGNWQSARERYRESLSLFLEVRSARASAMCLTGLAAVAAAQHEPTKGARLWGAVQAWEEKTGAKLVEYPVGGFQRSRYEQVLALARADLGAAAFAAAQEEGRALSLDQAVEYEAQTGF